MQSTTQKILKVSGLAIYVICFITGLLVSDDSMITAFLIWAAALFAGSLCFGLAKIIILLTEIKENQEKK